MIIFLEMPIPTSILMMEHSVTIPSTEVEAMIFSTVASEMILYLGEEKMIGLLAVMVMIPSEEVMAQTISWATSEMIF